MICPLLHATIKGHERVRVICVSVCKYNVAVFSSILAKHLCFICFLVARFGFFVLKNRYWVLACVANNVKDSLKNLL